MRVALYARVSTCNGQNPEMQLAELREYTSRRGWEIFGEYVDSGISGSTESRHCGALSVTRKPDVRTFIVTVV
jgi:DNA invertase Pin-like site-specific DNA recombinase